MNVYRHPLDEQMPVQTSVDTRGDFGRQVVRSLVWFLPPGIAITYTTYLGVTTPWVNEGIPFLALLCCYASERSNMTLRLCWVVPT